MLFCLPFLWAFKLFTFEVELDPVILSFFFYSLPILYVYSSNFFFFFLLFLTPAFVNSFSSTFLISIQLMYCLWKLLAAYSSFL